MKAKNLIGAELTYDYRVVLKHLGGSSFSCETLRVGDEVYDFHARESPQEILERAARRQVAAQAAEERAEAEAAADARRRRAEQTEHDRGEWREFTDSSGQFRLRAQLARFGGGVATLRKESGEEVKVALERLSVEDQEWIRGEIRRRSRR